MNVVKAFRAEPAAPARVARGEPSRADAVRQDGVRTDRDDAAEGIESARQPRRPEFADVLALLAGTGPRVRSDLLQQLPKEGASLVDRLLDGAGEGELPATDASLDAVMSDAITTAPTPTPTLTLTPTPTLTQAPAPTTDEASEALRYGMLQVLPDEPAAPSPTADDKVVDLAAFARARDLKSANGLIGLSRAAQMISLRGDGDNSQAMSVLTRIASQRGATTEQLLALGDARGADARQAIDALLAQAGTPAGLRLADQGVAMDSEAARMGVDSAMAHAANSHAAHALTAALGASAADVNTPVKDLDGVAPELRARMERVIERMKNEYGHDVTIVESVRSQERQDFLFEQGRTRSGQVVTWTRDSAHTRGDAVDVVIDGNWSNAEGFARLQRIAREEGLRTLGMKDPGHLELPRNGQGLDRAAAVSARMEAKITTMPPQAQAAGVARVAGVASVAGVARVAEASANAPTADAPTMNSSVAAYATQQQAGERGANDNSNGNAFGRGPRDEHGHPINNGKKLGHTKQDAAGSETSNIGALAPVGTGATSVTGTERAAVASPAAGSEQAQRVSDIQQMRADAPAGPLTRMTLNVDAANGTQERITLDVRGNVVDTFITTNPANVDKLRLHTAELQDALSKHGLEGETVRVNASTRAETVDAVRSAGTERELFKLGATPQGAANDGANANSQRDRAPSRESDKQDDTRREQQRARDDQQAGQRGRQNPFTGTK